MRPGEKVKKVLRIAGKTALCVVGLLVSYALVGMVLSLVPVNCDVVPGDDVVVYLENNGVHTDIIVPTRTGRIDWTAVVPPEGTRGKVAGEYLAVGWGSRDFYLNVPEWKDLTVGIVLRAISGTEDTVLHTTYRRKPSVGADCRRLSLSSAQYDSLARYILAGGKRSEAGAFIRIEHEGYGLSDAFYEGTGRYSPFLTCNTWANSALKACGQKCCLWTFLPQPIFWKHP